MKRFLTPGPTQMHPVVATGIQRAVKHDICSLSHRSSEFKDIYTRAEDGVRKLLSVPDTHAVLFLSSATEAMERIMQNTVEHTSLHLVNGAFSDRFYQIACELRKKPKAVKKSWGEGFDPKYIEYQEDIELLALTHNETSTGVCTPMDDVYTLREMFPEALVALDVVSSAPYVSIDHDKVDMSFFSVQKGFGLPAGLGVLIVGPRAREKSHMLHEKISTGSYHSFESLMKNAEKKYTPETPNVLGIFLLGEVCEALNTLGINAIRKDIEKRSQMLYSFFDNHKDYEVFVEDSMYRSPTVVVVRTPQDSQSIIDRISNEGVVVGAGYKDMKDTHIRVANFPMHTDKDINVIMRALS
jgi:phosphoserine aminotransferase